MFFFTLAFLNNCVLCISFREGILPSFITSGVLVIFSDTLTPSIFHDVQTKDSWCLGGQTPLVGAGILRGDPVES